MGYRVIASSAATDNMRLKYGPRKGLEGPFLYANGQVLYYDPAEGAYWDPTTDFYLSQDDVDRLHNQTLDLLRR